MPPASGPDDAIARLRRVESWLLGVQQLTEAERALVPAALPDRDDVAVLAAAIKSVRAGASFREGFGLPPAWRSRANADRRAALIRQLPKGSAREIESRLRRYAAAGFLVDQRRAAPPEGERGIMFEIVKLGSGTGPSLSTIKRALAGSRPPMALSRRILSHRNHASNSQTTRTRSRADPAGPPRRAESARPGNSSADPRA
jgi:hypothetical protein